MPMMFGMLSRDTTLREHSGSIAAAFRKHFGSIPGAFQEHPEASGSIPGASGSIPRASGALRKIPPRLTKGKTTPRESTKMTVLV